MTQVATLGGTEKARFGDGSPGVDLVIPTHGDDLITVTTKRLIGALHRRLWSKVDVLRRTSVVSDSDGFGYGQGMVPSVNSLITLDLDGAGWAEQLVAYSRVVEQASRRRSNERAGIRIRGWHEDERGVLVDGRPVPACFVDLAVVALAYVEPMRRDEQPLVIIHEPSGKGDDVLWTSLFHLCQDRLGIERGVLEFHSASPQLRSGIPAVA